MNELLSTLLVTVITAAVPVLTAYGVTLIKRAAEEAAANTESTKQQTYIAEIAEAVSVAVSATSQTYVDALKNKGEFTEDAQKQAAQMALSACVASLTPAARTFIEKAYGDLNDYLKNKIEAEVRNQKLGTATLVAL